MITIETWKHIKHMERAERMLSNLTYAPGGKVVTKDGSDISITLDNPHVQEYIAAKAKFGGWM